MNARTTTMLTLAATTLASIPFLSACKASYRPPTGGEVVITFDPTDRVAVYALLDSLDDEKDAEVLVSLAINALAAAGEMRLSWRVQGRMWDKVWPVLKRANLPDPAENAALHDLGRSFRWRTDVDAHQALEGLRRFWAE